MEQKGEYLVNIWVLVVVLKQYPVLRCNPLRFKTLRPM
ncbi:hypothetical protein BFV96_4890 [Alteromonas macleodii]|uniref:Uncharacterized protein n=1 Tax=Alteromonas macleodii TaxID=28108 RepID=A0AB36FM95_ALTMA|nr:hypothetical protein BFV95_4942 [Alteromonas macleodii]OES25157.1 hypothetical protein BFV93_4488 [Alteromonas macleodii]OES38479.1 hypothetical protein BFV96_4890 [Alteromonas macleodii]